MFIRNIPADTDPKRLGRFVADGLDPRPGFLPWRRKGGILAIKIMALLDVETRLAEYHGLVEVESELAADLVVKRLNLRVFGGRRVVVRRYRERSPANDRRHGQSQATARLFYDRRAGDRRRRCLEWTMVAATGAVPNPAKPADADMAFTKFNPRPGG